MIDAKAFKALLENPEQLKETRYQDLEGLLAKYPYCQPLRFLLLKKFKTDEHPAAAKHLALASMYAFDRSFLYDLLHESPLEYEINVAPLSISDEAPNEAKESLNESEEKAIIEEPPIAEEIPLEEKIEEELPIEEEIIEQKEEPKVIIEKEEKTEDPSIPVIRSVPLEEAPIIIEDLGGISPGELEEDLSLPLPDPLNLIQPEDDDSLSISINQKLEVEEEKIKKKIPSSSGQTPIVKKKKKKSGPKKKKEKVQAVSSKKFDKVSSKKSEDSSFSFTSWLSSLDTTDIPKEKSTTPKKKKKSTPKKKKVAPLMEEQVETSDKTPELKQLIQKSVTPDKMIISETLAHLLAIQGKSKEAMAMYQQLSLKYPEKSSYFAGKIKNLKNLL